ncbi:MAG: hypothetical protein QW279_07710 [Candidatus Jordarchaeaceae archaeon]
MFENKSTRIVSMVLRGISLFCLVGFFLMLLFATRTGINARSVVSPPFLIAPGFFFTYPAIPFLMLAEYLSVIYPSAIMFLVIISCLILVSLLTGFLGVFLWRVSSVAEKFGEAKEKLLMVLVEWRKEKPARFTVGVASLAASYIFALLLIQVFVLPDLGHYIFGFYHSFLPHWIAVSSFLLLIVTVVIYSWFETNIASEVLRQQRA